MNYNEAMNYITQTAKFGSNYGLSRTEKVLEFLGNPHKDIKAIHIAGTNGKGSTTAMITSVLMEAGFKVGMYTSPFLEEFEERIQIDRENIPKDRLATVVTEVKEAVDKVIELGYENPTEFEIITCAMFKYFKDEKVDYAVVEVGLGGRLDSTNVITPIVSVITSISYDHMNILGNTLGQIAGEKAGIIKENVPVVIYPQEAEAEEVFTKVAKEKRSAVYSIGEDWARLISSKEKDHTQKLFVKTDIHEYEVNLPLLGTYQLLNCATAIKCLEVISGMGCCISKSDIINGLAKVKWMGRVEVLYDNPLVVIDGAHNIDAIKKLKESVDQYFDYKRMVLIIGILSDKQVKEMLEEITPLADKVIISTPHSYRAGNPEDLKAVVKKLDIEVEIIDDYEKAFDAAKNYCVEDDLILICGSLYMIGDMRKTIKK